MCLLQFRFLVPWFFGRDVSTIIFGMFGFVVSDAFRRVMSTFCKFWKVWFCGFGGFPGICVQCFACLVCLGM